MGVALAQLLDWGLVDIDDVITAEVGSVPAFIESAGIDAFRVRERAAIHRLPSLLRDTVVSVGGGAVLDPANRDALSSLGRVVWLRATLETLLDHLGDSADRPLLAEGAEAALTRLLDERTPIYEALASVLVDVDQMDPNEVAVAIVKELTAA